MHLLFYDYEKGKVDHMNDVSWIFRKISCDENETPVIPVDGYDVFKQFRIIDDQARNKIITEINAPVDAREGLRIKPKNQREVLETLLTLYREGKLSKDGTLPVYDLLLKQNLVAWEEDFAEFMQEFRRTKNAEALLASVDGLIAQYKIEARVPAGIKKLDKEDLELIGYVFLSRLGTPFPMLIDPTA